MAIHEPYELRQMDLKELQAKIIKDEKANTITCSIKNPEYRYKIEPYIGHNTEEGMARLKIIMKYRLFQFKLQKKLIRYCTCGNLIFDKRKFVDLCNECCK